MHPNHWSAMRGQSSPGPQGAGRNPRGTGGGFPGFGPRSFGPGFGQGGPRARRGDVRSAILGLLADGPSNGYGLIKAIGERTDGAWQPSPGSVYPTLAQLVDEGLIAQDEGPRGAYSLTATGGEYVAEHRETIDGAFENARGGSGMFQGGEDLMTAIGKFMAVVSQFRRGVSEDQRVRAAAKIDELRRELYTILAE